MNTMQSEFTDHAAALTTIVDAATARAELAPTGRLRVGVVFAPAVSTFFVVKSDGRKPVGVTVDLGEQLAAALELPTEFLVVPNSGELTDAIESGFVDVAFLPVDDERKKRIDFGPSYFLIQSTGLVRGDSEFRITDDLNRTGVRVVGIVNTTTIRSAERVLPHATVIPVPSVQEAMNMLQQKRVDAVALSRDVLTAYQKRVTGSRLLDGQLHSTGIAIAVRKGLAAALNYVSVFLENAKASGAIRAAFDRAGLQLDPVAPSENVVRGVHCLEPFAVRINRASSSKPPIPGIAQ